MSWVKLHRKFLFWQWYDEPNTLRLFLHLLLNANFENKKWHGITVKSGQLVIGRKILAKELKLSEQEIRTSIARLKSTNEITINSTNKFSIVTICKWNSYQAKNEDEQPAKQPTEQPTNNQQITTTKENKKERIESEGKTKRFSTPSIQEIQSYFSIKITEKKIQLNPKVEAEKFESFYSSKNWMIGKNKMTDWKKSVSGWIARSTPTNGNAPKEIEPPKGLKR